MIMWAAQPQRGPLAPPGGLHRARSPPTAKPRRQSFTIGIDQRLDGRRHHRGRSAGAVQALDRRSATRSPKRTRRSIQIRAIRDQVNKALREGVGATKKAEIQALADSLLKPLTVVEEEVYQVRKRERPGSAELPDQVEQQDRGAAGRGRKLRQQADRSEPTWCSRNCRRSSMRSCRSCRSH